MKERPILFNGDMVRAILDGHKTQTRRVVDVSKIKPSTWKHEGIETIRPVAELGWNHKDQWQAKTNRYNVWSKGFLCPYGKVGDRLWVREAFCPDPPDDDSWCYYEYSDGAVHRYSNIPVKYQLPKHVLYRATDDFNLQWHSPIFMPRWASRITLEITGVRVERLNEISGADCSAEGIFHDDSEWHRGCIGIDEEISRIRGAFRNLWDKINGKTHSWASNPFVWVLEFKRIEEAK